MTNTGMRAGMVPIGRRLRAYFAPVDRETGKAPPFDPAKHGVFLLDAPPTPWIDLGWIENFARRAELLLNRCVLEHGERFQGNIEASSKHWWNSIFANGARFRWHCRAALNT